MSGWVPSQAVPLVQLRDADEWRWYCYRGDEENPPRYFASVTNLLSVAVHERLQAWMRETSAEKQGERLEHAADVGHRIHNAIEADLRGEWIDEGTDIARPLLLWRKLKEHHNIKAYATETPVCSERLGFAGTIDIIGEFDGQPCILDIKTGRYGVKTGWQMSGYKLAYEEMTGRNDLGMVGLSIRRDGYIAEPFVYSHFDWCLKSFLATYHVWKALYYWKLDGMKWGWLHTDVLNGHLT